VAQFTEKGMDLQGRGSDSALSAGWCGLSLS
jgi:hypothetical protein